MKYNEIRDDFDDVYKLFYNIINNFIKYELNENKKECEIAINWDIIKINNLITKNKSLDVKEFTHLCCIKFMIFLQKCNQIYKFIPNNLYKLIQQKIEQNNELTETIN